MVETPSFAKLAGDCRDEAERLEFITWLATDPTVGVVIPGSNGVREVRWSRPGGGKRGGVRVIYFTRGEREEIRLLLIYAKSARENIPTDVLKRIREEIER